MKHALLLAGLIVISLLLSLGCNGASLQEPTNNPLPGSGIDNILIDDIEANYAIDIIPEREIPLIPTEPPRWEPRFGCLTDEPSCINEGCMFFELGSFNPDTKIATFKVAFFNSNSDSSVNYTIFMILNQIADGISPINPDDEWPTEKGTTINGPYYAFNKDNSDIKTTPDSMYTYYEREISFQLEEGSDFFVEYSIIPIADQHDLSYSIDRPDPAQEGNQSGNDNEGRNGGYDENGQQGGGNASPAPSAQPEYETPPIHSPSN